jgi:hypothetical protein
MSLACYVAAPYGDSTFVREHVHERLRSFGVEPTSRWAEDARGPEDFSRLLPAELRAAAEGNDRDIERSDALLAIARHGAGGEMFSEIRFGLTLGLPVVWVGRRTLSAWRAGVMLVEDLDEAIEVLLRIRRRSA